MFFPYYEKSYDVKHYTEIKTTPEVIINRGQVVRRGRGWDLGTTNIADNEILQKFPLTAILKYDFKTKKVYFKIRMAKQIFERYSNHHFMVKLNGKEGLLIGPNESDDDAKEFFIFKSKDETEFTLNDLKSLSIYLTKGYRGGYTNVAIGLEVAFKNLTSQFKENINVINNSIKFSHIHEIEMKFDNGNYNLGFLNDRNINAKVLETTVNINGMETGKGWYDVGEVTYKNISFKDHTLKYKLEEEMLDNFKIHNFEFLETNKTNYMSASLKQLAPIENNNIWTSKIICDTIEVWNKHKQTWEKSKKGDKGLHFPLNYLGRLQGKINFTNKMFANENQHFVFNQLITRRFFDANDGLVKLKIDTNDKPISQEDENKIKWTHTIKK
ncbi:Uncharacterised protein [Metamycoplasma arthritidis]|uniref:Uncharacterized protein n=1 Tax=Metamycoplasma arthritidis (strain 158L3-1) TaxID=243272 RepID=B3PMB6_META1|nr:hypothetical protein [Metamycoplasma arthritidis]ACF07168.1 hypothetical protein MARTH_orf264 [Metamycoplasma arthritidis 158L3-1]VEU78692.1 Uncharacterised protein [Metamycoplasma arthritidis]